MLTTVQDKIKALNKKDDSKKENKEKIELNDYRTTKRSRKKKS
jgi:hypothetical protein